MREHPCARSHPTAPRAGAGKRLDRGARFHRKPGWECCLSPSLGAEELVCTILILPVLCSLDSALQRSLPPGIAGMGLGTAAPGWASGSHQPRAFPASKLSHIPPKPSDSSLYFIKTGISSPSAAPQRGVRNSSSPDGMRAAPSPGAAICWNKVWLPRILLRHQICFFYGSGCEGSDSQSLLPEEPNPSGFSGLVLPQRHRGLLTLA